MDGSYLGEVHRLPAARPVTDVEHRGEEDTEPGAGEEEEAEQGRRRRRRGGGEGPGVAVHHRGEVREGGPGAGQGGVVEGVEVEPLPALLPLPALPPPRHGLELRGHLGGHPRLGVRVQVAGVEEGLGERQPGPEEGALGGQAPHPATQGRQQGGGRRGALACSALRAPPRREGAPPRRRREWSLPWGARRREGPPPGAPPWPWAPPGHSWGRCPPPPKLDSCVTV